MQIIFSTSQKKKTPAVNIILNPAEIICLISLLCSLFIFITSVNFYASSELNSTFAFCILIALSIYILIYYYLSQINNELSVFVKILINILKFSWIPVSAYSYVTARKTIMEIIDIPYEKTFSLAATLGLSAIIYTFLYSFLFVAVIVTLALYKLKLKNMPSRWNKKISQKAPNLQVFTLLIFTGLTLCMFYSLNFERIMLSSLNKTIPFDTRNTFYCHDQYMAVKETPNGLYMYVSEGNYRMAGVINNEYTFSRLKCIDTPPYYTLVPVKNAQVLVYDQLDANLTLLQDDIRKATADK